MPRFVILTHDHPVLHWDFMLEMAGVLRTWRLAAQPEPEISIAADALPDHRLDYLEYEGPVSGNRGNVLRWDSGEYEWQEEGSTKLAVLLAGEKLSGRVVLELESSGQCWTFSFTSL